MVWALILAAGESRRMGSPKMLLPYAGSTVIETVIRAALGSKVDKVCVVLGSHRREIEARIRNYSVMLMHNPDYKEGMLSSVQAGFRRIPPSVEAVCICLGDQPRIPGRIIDAVLDERSKSGKGIVIPVHKERRGHPLLVHMKYRDQVMSLKPWIGLRELIRLNPGDVATVEVDTPSVNKDIDTPEDYRDQS